MPTLNFLDENGLLYFSGLIKAELNKKAPINSPNFTGTPTAPTPASQQDNSTKIATTAFVQGAISALLTIIDNGIQTITLLDMLNLTDPLPSGVYYMSDTYLIYISKNTDLLCIDSFGGLQFRHWDFGDRGYDVPNLFGKLTIDLTYANKVGLANIYNGDGDESVYINSATSSNAGVMSAADKNILNRIIALLGGGADNYNLNGATSPIDIGNIYDASNTNLFYYSAYNDNSENVGIIISNVDNNDNVTSTSYQLLLSPKGVYSRRGIVNSSTNSVSWSEWKTWTEVATTSANGLMSASDKIKLNSVETGAQVNKIESIIVNNTTLAINNKSVNINLSNYINKNDITLIDWAFDDYYSNPNIPSSYLASGNSHIFIATKGTIYNYRYDVDKDYGNEEYPCIIFLGQYYAPDPSNPNDQYRYVYIYNGYRIYRKYYSKIDGWSSYDSDNKEFEVDDLFSLNRDLNSKAPKASPALTGTPTAPTAASGTNSTQIATTAFVQSAIAAAVTGSFKFVNTLPVTGEEGYIYLVPHTHTSGTTSSNPDVKDEYIWNTSTTPALWELIGNTDLDLSTHWSKSELTVATNNEILAIWNSVWTTNGLENNG